MRVFVYVQGLTGSGHVVRTGEIARELAAAHQVWLTDGGRPVPRRPMPRGVHVIRLPRICRNGPVLAPLDDSLAIGDVLAERRRLLLEAVEQSQPDVLIVEHFPVSKWELHEEILAVIKAVQRKQGAKVVCSLRDISPRHRYDTGAEEHTRRTSRLLETYFDRLLVHADPQFVNLVDSAAWTKGLSIPIEYTGFVSEKLRVCERTDADVASNGSHSIVVSMGGAGNTTLACQAIAAWKLIEARGEAGRRTLAIFLPLSVTDKEIEQLDRIIDGYSICLQPFSLDFLDHLGRADLSLSHGGYNTMMNLLETRTRAIIVPISTMADQLPRALRMTAHGLASTLEHAELEPGPLAQAILAALNAPDPRTHST